MDPDKLEACYGPFGKAGWDVIEAQLDKLCEGMTLLEKYGASFNLNLATGEITRIVPK